MASPIQYFVSRAPTYMALLMKDFEFDELDAAAIMGNAGHESGGLTIYHETGQPDHLGGVGWFQWTADRRKAFEAYCARNNYNPHTDETNYKYLFVELTETSEKAVIPKLKAAQGLEAKTKLFCDVFERPGVKAYDSRLIWAQRALDAFNATDIPNPPKEPEAPKLEADPTLAELVRQIKLRTGADKILFEL